MKVHQYLEWMIPFILEYYPYILDLYISWIERRVRGKMIRTHYIHVVLENETLKFTKYNNFLYGWLLPQNPRYFQRMLDDIQERARIHNNQ